MSEVAKQNRFGFRDKLKTFISNINPQLEIGTCNHDKMTHYVDEKIEQPKTLNDMCSSDFIDESYSQNRFGIRESLMKFASKFHFIDSHYNETDSCEIGDQPTDEKGEDKSEDSSSTKPSDGKCDCGQHKEEDDFEKERETRFWSSIERKLYTSSKPKYYSYRVAKRFIKSGEGCAWGFVEGLAVGLGVGCKWGGAGGWIIGSISQALSCFIGGFCGACGGAIIGARTDRKRVMNYWLNYKNSFGVGGGASSALRGTWN